jgi:predicted MFS family arabinose efflux permease
VTTGHRPHGTGGRPAGAVVAAEHVGRVIEDMGPGVATVPYQERRRGWRLSFGLVLALAMAVSVYSIPAFAVLSGLLIEDLGIDRTQFGLIVTAAAVSNAACAVLAGKLADRIGGRAVLLGVFALTAASAGLLALAPSFPALLVLAALAGAPNGANNPATNKVIAEHVPAGHRGAVVGTKQSGVQAGMFLIGLSLPPLALATNWRLSLLLVVGVALLGLMAAIRVLPPESRSHRAGSTGAAGGRLPVAVRWLTGYAVLMGAGGSAVTSFLPLYAHEGLGLTLPVAGAAAASVGLVGMAARIGLGRYMDRMGHVAVPLAVIAAGSAVSAGGLLLAATASWVLWFSVALAGVTIATWNAITMMAAISASAEQAGRVTGLLVLGFMGGYALSPVLFGTSVEGSGGYALGWASVAGLFCLAGLLMLAWRRVTVREGVPPSRG